MDTRPYQGPQMDYLRVHREAKLVNSDQKEQGLVCFAGFSSKGYTVGKALGRQIVYHCDSAGVSRACSQEVSVSSKPLQGHLPHKRYQGIDVTELS